jgi:hypothetical protein
MEKCMAEDEPLKIPTLLGLLWGKLLMQKRYPDAIVVSLLGYSLSQSMSDKRLETESLSQLFTAVEEFRGDRGTDLPPQSAAPACSFCRRSEPAVRLVAGANGFICNECVQTAHEVLSASKPSTS